MEGNVISVALIGAGYAAFLHGNAYRSAGGVPFRLKTVVDTDLTKAEKIRDEYGFEAACASYSEVLDDPEIDVVDLVTPPFLHKEMIEAALAAGKHVICEKPLIGYFGRPGDPAPIGDKVPKEDMYHAVMGELDSLRTTVANSKGHFYYAENHIYAPAVRKMADIIRRKKSKILSIKATTSLKGSSSPLAGSWAATGGGCWARNGIHPLTAVLWLKQQEAQARGETIYPTQVLADMGRTTESLGTEEHAYIAAHPIDVEDNSVVVVTFSDGTKAMLYTSDTALGGTRNLIDVYCNDNALECRLTDTDLLNTYLSDERGLDGFYLAEMLPSMTGWNRAFVADDVLRGHAGELKSFLQAIAEDRDADSSFDLAYDTIRILYAAYWSAEIHAAVSLACPLVGDTSVPDVCAC